MNLKRLIALLTAALLMITLTPVHAEEVELVVRSAPLSRAAETRNGMVRVYLSSLGSVSKLDLTVIGSYSVDGAAEMALSDGQQVSIGFDASTGQITLTAGGATYAMGNEMALRRHQTNGQSALRIAQANRPNNLYPGDLQLIARSSGSGYKLYPIVHVYIEYYLYGVVPYEMSSSWPAEALKAQAVAARTFTLNRMSGRASSIYDVVDTSSDQVYNGHAGSETNATRAVDATQGIVIMSNGSLCGTYYTASNGGQTESVANVWGSAAYPYLGVKDDPFDLANTNTINRRLDVYSTFSDPSQNATLKALLTARAQSLYGSGVTIARINSITPHTPKYAAPSRLYTKLDFGVTLSNGAAATLTFGIFDELEGALSMSINSSANELWSVESNGSNFIIRVRRYGHGVGMSQRGAQQMASMGYTYDQILGFYYEGCERVQYTFTNTILPSIGTTPSEPPLSGDEMYAIVASELSTLNLRSGPSTTYEVIAEIPKGTRIVVTSYGSEWCAVRWGSWTGYVMTKYLSFSEDEPTPSPSPSPTPSPLPTNVPSGSPALTLVNADLREAASTGSAILLMIPSGETVTVISWGEAWSQVTYVGLTGYLPTESLRLYQDMQTDQPATPMPTPTPTPTPAPSVSATPVPTFEPVNASAVIIMNAQLRQEPDTGSILLGTVPAGETVRVTASGTSWSQIVYQGQTGWVLTSQLHITAQQPEPEPSEEPTDAPVVNEEIEEAADPNRIGVTAWIASTVDSVNLRAAASTEAEVLAAIPAMDSVIVLEQGDTWSLIRYGGQQGYVFTRYLTYAEPATSLGVRYVSTETDPLALRDAPSTSGRMLARMDRGSMVTLLRQEGDWCFVQYGQQQGYCAARYLSAVKPEERVQDDTRLLDSTLQAVTGWTAIVRAEGSIFLRDWCSTDAPVGAEVMPDTHVTLRKKGDIWCLIATEGNEGYCLTSQLTLIAPAE